MKNKIIVGDTLQVLKSVPDDFVDVTVTSPPYNKKEKNKGWMTTNVKYDNSSDTMPESDYQQNQIDVLNELYRITKPGGSMFYNHKLRWDKGQMFHPMEWLVKSNWNVRQEIIWDRMNAANIRGWRFWQVEERIYWLYKPVDDNLIGTELLSKHALLTSIWRFPAERQDKKTPDSRHPAPFPIILPARCITSVMDNRPGLVLDPYCGSGTSLLAAKLLGKDYLGIDASEQYTKYALDRLKNPSADDVTKLEAELKKHVVTKTFKQRKLDGEWKNDIRGKRKPISEVQNPC